LSVSLGTFTCAAAAAGAAARVGAASADRANALVSASTAKTIITPPARFILRRSSLNAGHTADDCGGL
jgi:hypothetical protein